MTLGFCWLFVANIPPAGMKGRSSHRSAAKAWAVSGHQIAATGRFPVEKPACLDYGRAAISCSLEFDCRASTKDG